MQDRAEPEIDIEPPVQGLKALATQLGDDVVSFARAEAAWLKAEAGERALYARPAVMALGVGVALALGVLIALPVGLLLVIGPIIGTAPALGIVVLLFLVVAALLFRFGSLRLKAAFGPRSAR